MKWFYKEDWVQIWNQTGIWTDKSGGKKGTCYFMIDWSASRKKYRLRTDGYNPKSHTQYQVALNKLTELNLEFLNDKSEIRDKKLKQLGIK